MRTSRAVVVVLAAATLIAAAAPATAAPAAPATAAPAAVSPAAAVTGGPDLAHGEVRRESGTVAWVGDGDTFRIALARGSRRGGRAPERVVRLIGVQAPETARQTLGECGGEGAHAFLRGLAQGRPVVLASASDSKAADGRRLLRTAYVQTSDGTWVDASAAVLEAGWGQWFPKRREPVHNLDYRGIADRAQRAARGIWNPQACGPTNDADVPVRLWIQADPTGNDFTNVNGEYVLVANESPTRDLDISGWVVRDGSLHWFRFPDGAVVPAGGHVRLRVGQGSGTAATYFWGRGRPIFSNRGVTREYMGDGVYLLDRRGNIRASVVYPCFGPCDTPDPLRGVLRIARVRYDPPGGDRGRTNAEYVRMVNTGAAPVRLIGYEVRIGGWVYDFDPDEVLAPGASLVLHVGSGRPSGEHRFLGAPHVILDNAGDVVRVRSLDGRLVDCLSWGWAKSTCPR